MKKYHVIGILQRIRRLFLILRKNQFLYVLGISYYFVCILLQICYNWVFQNLFSSESCNSANSCNWQVNALGERNIFLHSIYIPKNSNWYNTWNIKMCSPISLFLSLSLSLSLSLLPLRLLWETLETHAVLVIALLATDGCVVPHAWWRMMKRIHAVEHLFLTQENTKNIICRPCCCLQTQCLPQQFSKYWPYVIKNLKNTII